MPKVFRVVDLSASAIEPVEKVVNANSPEAAAREVLGMDLVRSGAKKDLMARFYWQLPSTPMNMVRLYRRIDEARRG